MTFLSPVTTILPKLRGSPMGNGDADWCATPGELQRPGSTMMAEQYGFLSMEMERHRGRSCLRSWGNYYYASGRAGFCNGEWRMWSSISVHAAWDAGRSHVLLACWGDNAAMETTMEEGNRQINLSSRI